MDCINSSISNGQFLTELEMAHVIPIFQKGFRSRYGMQHALILMDLSKGFDCLLHESILAKLYAYGGDMKSCRFS